MEQRLPWIDVAQGPVLGKREKPLGVFRLADFSCRISSPPAVKRRRLFIWKEWLTLLRQARPHRGDLNAVT